MSEYISVERRGHLLLVGLNRPEKRNAMNVEMFVDIGRAYAQLDRDDDLRCGILHAHGDHFTAGLDLAEWAPVFAGGQMPIAPDGLDPLGLQGPPLRKPLLCAVQGICFTIGIELMLATDVRVAARGTRFGQIEIKRGIYPVGGATIRMPREAGWANAMRWLLTGDEFSADDAHRVGLVQEVVEPGQQLDRAVEIAEHIAAQAPLGVRATLASSRMALAARRPRRRPASRPTWPRSWPATTCAEGVHPSSRGARPGSPGTDRLSRRRREGALLPPPGQREGARTRRRRRRGGGSHG